jgi:hypothetical protein
MLNEEVEKLDRHGPEISQLKSTRNFALIDRSADVVLKAAALLGVSSVVISMCRLAWLCADGIILSVVTLFAVLVALVPFGVAVILVTGFFGDWRARSLQGSNWKGTMGNVLIFLILWMVETSFLFIVWHSFLITNADFTCA